MLTDRTLTERPLHAEVAAGRLLSGQNAVAFFVKMKGGLPMQVAESKEPDHTGRASRPLSNVQMELLKLYSMDLKDDELKVGLPEFTDTGR